MRLYVDHKFSLSVAVSAIHLQAVFWLALGCGFLTAIVVRWNRHVTDAVLAKLLRRELSRQEANEPDA